MSTPYCRFFETETDLAEYLLGGGTIVSGPNGTDPDDDSACVAVCGGSGSGGSGSGSGPVDGGCPDVECDYQEFAAGSGSTDWVCTATSIILEMWGAGGNGSPGPTLPCGGGGGGGAYLKVRLDGLTCGYTYSLDMTGESCVFNGIGEDTVTCGGGSAPGEGGEGGGPGGTANVSTGSGFWTATVITNNAGGNGGSYGGDGGGGGGGGSSGFGGAIDGSNAVGAIHGAGGGNGADGTDGDGISIAGDGGGGGGYTSASGFTGGTNFATLTCVPA